MPASKNALRSSKNVVSRHVRPDGAAELELTNSGREQHQRGRVYTSRLDAMCSWSNKQPLNKTATVVSYSQYKAPSACHWVHTVNNQPVSWDNADVVQQRRQLLCCQLLQPRLLRLVGCAGKVSSPQQPLEVLYVLFRHLGGRGQQLVKLVQHLPAAHTSANRHSKQDQREALQHGTEVPDRWA